MKIIKRTNDLPLFDQFFDGFFRDEPLNWMNRNAAHTSKEAVNILEDENGFTIELLAPGFSREDLSLEVEGKQLKLVAQRSENETDSNTKHLRKEFSIHGFERRFQIPENRVETGEISAHFVNGILEVRLPKKEEAKLVKHQIEVK